MQLLPRPRTGLYDPTGPGQTLKRKDIRSGKVAIKMWKGKRQNREDIV